MAIKQERRPDDPPIIVDPKEFLAKPFTGLQVSELENPPGINLLRWLPTLKEETGLVYRMSRWFVIKASSEGVPIWLMPSDSNILLHSHPILENEEENDGSIPSLGDYLNCSPSAKNFIVSLKGLTQYWPVGPEEKRYLERTLPYGCFRKTTKPE